MWYKGTWGAGLLQGARGSRATGFLHEKARTWKDFHVCESVLNEQLIFKKSLLLASVGNYLPKWRGSFWRSGSSSSTWMWSNKLHRHIAHQEVVPFLAGQLVSTGNIGASDPWCPWCLLKRDQNSLRYKSDYQNLLQKHLSEQVHQKNSEQLVRTSNACTVNALRTIEIWGCEWKNW